MATLHVIFSFFSIIRMVKAFILTKTKDMTGSLIEKINQKVK